MTEPRYAVYFSPEPGSALARFGWDWLGRRPDCADFAPLPDLGFPSSRHEQVIADARRYGFHATLKPPFRLARGSTLADLRAAMAAFADQEPAFTVPPLELHALDGFLALRTAEPSPRIHALADQCVRRFDRFRAPASTAETAKRLSANLGPRQRGFVERWGYPYVFEDYRFHMTLTCRLDDPERSAWSKALASLLQTIPAEPVAFRSICLFAQPAPQAPFQVIERFSLTQ